MLQEPVIVEETGAEYVKIPAIWRGKTGYLRFVDPKARKDRKHERALKRIPNPLYLHSRTVLDPIAAELVPWTIWNYCGKTRYLAWVCGVSRETMVELLKDARPLSAVSLERLAVFLEQKAAALVDLASQCRKQAKARPPHASVQKRSQATLSADLLPPPK